ncbi:signal peptide peptidase SppA [Adhaeribacter rhizoryzae]|uniref:Signal peptide peptidase SppA n=1 Tax=Adhaeribacter rhizoryzae TaxID=2607907 RepID=A0A5M6DQY8_9BACT|nr:signal peptide peptidase SppA [Adhaeribacter rhizoryzae]KAA5548610.1 signal peptide peptidase SppA [Adhaeribacter rhizoryzae]
MLQFFKYTLATLVGLFLFFFLMFLILLGIAAAAASEDEVTVRKNSILELKLDREIDERGEDDPFEGMGLLGGLGNAKYGLDEIKASIRHAKSDDNIKGIYLSTEILSAGMATVEEIRNELLDFKKSGKFIVAYNDICSEKAYYLTSVADKQFLNPQGALEINGLSSEIMFFKGTLEKLDIQPEIFKVGEFKSAVEPFVLDKMSAPNRLQVTSFLNSLNNHYLQNVAKARNKSFGDMKKISDSMLIHYPEDALKHGIITNVGYYDQAVDYMKQRTGLKKTDKLNVVELKSYRKVAKEEDKYSKNRIAVIYATGEIVNGEGGKDNIGGTKFAEEIRKARRDKNVKAIVLRINSPGGSAMASDVIWREITLAKKEKPVIASMSDVAASGGYYIAMAADTIVAYPNTITGSIGVFGILANLEGFLDNKLGITVDRVKTGRFSDMPTITRQLNPAERQIIQHGVERIYDDFTSKAAAGRNMPVAQLRNLAGGRVWSGIEAKERGLVDVLGGLDKAIEIAAKRAGIEKEYTLKKQPHQKTFLETFMSGMETSARTRFLKAELGEMYPYYEKAKKMQQLQGIQVRMPYDFSIQ